MIITKTVKIKITKKNIVFYREKGYVCNLKDIIYVKTSDLSEGSHIKIFVKCDICGGEKQIKNQNYIKSFKNGNYYACSTICAKTKIVNTCITKYGVDNYSKTNKYKNKIKKTCLEKYGVDHYSKTIEYVERTKKTNLDKYGVDNYNKTDECKLRKEKTNLEKYGCIAPTQNKEVLKKRETTYFKKYGFITNLMCDDTKDKIKKTCLLKYGVENVSQNKKIKNKKIKTCLKNYGVENPLQNTDIFNKQQKSAHKSKKYNNINYRGTYELDFLTKFSDDIEIKNSDSIDYYYNNKKRKYHPDFYLPKYHLIIEIKSSYTYEYELSQNLSKKEYSLKSGYNFLFIINKDYTEFLSIIN